jgi:hypothetical protein
VDWDAVSTTPFVSSEKEMGMEIEVEVGVGVFFLLGLLPWKRVFASYHFPTGYVALSFFL